MQSFFANESLAYCSRPEFSFAELHIHAIRRIQATSRAQISRIASRLFLVSYMHFTGRQRLAVPFDINYTMYLVAWNA
jgi:hypothetical protein